jgi:hypothetical protein
MNNSIIIVIFCVIIIALIFSINSVYLPQHTPSSSPLQTTYILSKFYPLIGYASGNTKILFYTNTSPIGCISYAVVKNYAYNVTSQKLYLVNETKITSATSVENLYNVVGNSDLADNQQELFMAINGTSNYYVTILQNQTLLCGG